MTLENTDDVSKINSTNSDLTQNDLDTLVNNFASLKVYGWHFGTGIMLIPLHKVLI